MKKRKILVLFPLLGLLLSGCTFQEGYTTTKNWISDHIIQPIKNLFNKDKKSDDSKQDDSKKDDSNPSNPDDPSGGGGGGDPTTVKEIGSLTSPLSVSNFHTEVDKVLDDTGLDNGGTNQCKDIIFYVAGKVTSNSAKDEKFKDIQFLNMADSANSSVTMTAMSAVFDSSVDEKYATTTDDMAGFEVVVKGYAALYRKQAGSELKYELAKLDNNTKPTILKVTEGEKQSEPEKLNKTLAEIVATSGTKSQAYVSSATISSWADNKGNKVTEAGDYGNMFISDGVNEVYCYGASGVATDLAWVESTGEYKMNNSHQFKTNAITKDLKVGDTIYFWGIYFLYNQSPQMNIIITGSELVPVSSISFGAISDPIEMELGKASAVVQLEATVLPENATDKAVVWTTGDSSIATVVDGLVTAKAVGQTTVTATAHDGSGAHATANINVTQSAATLDSIEVSATGTVKTAYTAGEAFSPEGLTVTAHYSDSSTDTVTSSVTWSYKVGDTAVTEAAAAHDGATLKIIATLGSVSDEYDVTISVASQVSIKYVFDNPVDTVAKKLSELTDSQILGAFVTESSQSVVTSVSDYDANVYFGGNGGSGDTAYEIMDCLKIGKSKANGTVTLGLNTSLNITSVKFDVLGARDDGSLTVNNVTQNVTTKAAKDSLTPQTLEYTFSSSPTSLVLSTKTGNANYSIFVVGIEFIVG